MRIMLALLYLVLTTSGAAAQVEHRTFQDANGRNTGRSVTDTKGNTTYFNAQGQQTGRSVTRGNTTTIYDAMGRQTGTVRRR